MLLKFINANPLIINFNLKMSLKVLEKFFLRKILIVSFTYLLVDFLPLARTFYSHQPGKTCTLDLEKKIEKIN